jgi:hypothetical protein
MEVFLLGAAVGLLVGALAALRAKRAMFRELDRRQAARTRALDRHRPNVLAFPGGGAA